jgi:hypothetical protein
MREWKRGNERWRVRHGAMDEDAAQSLLQFCEELKHQEDIENGT